MMPYFFRAFNDNRLAFNDANIVRLFGWRKDVQGGIGRNEPMGRCRKGTVRRKGVGRENPDLVLSMGGSADGSR